MSALLEVRDLSMRFGGLLAVDGSISRLNVGKFTPSSALMGRAKPQYLTASAVSINPRAGKFCWIATPLTACLVIK